MQSIRRAFEPTDLSHLSVAVSVRGQSGPECSRPLGARSGANWMHNRDDQRNEMERANECALTRIQSFPIGSDQREIYPKDQLS